MVEEYHLTYVPYILTLDGNDVAWVNRIWRDRRNFDVLGKGDERCRFYGIAALCQQAELAWYTLIGDSNGHLFRTLEREVALNIGSSWSELLVTLGEENLLHIVQLSTCNTHGCSTGDRHRTESQDVHTALVVLVGIEVVLTATGKTRSEHQCSHG